MPQPREPDPEPPGVPEDVPGKIPRERARAFRADYIYPGRGREDNGECPGSPVGHARGRGGRVVQLMIKSHAQTPYRRSRSGPGKPVKAWPTEFSFKGL